MRKILVIEPTVSDKIYREDSFYLLIQLKGSLLLKYQKKIRN